MLAGMWKQSFTFTLKVLPQVANSYKTLVINYQNIRCHNLENHNLDLLTECKREAQIYWVCSEVKSGISAYVCL